MSERSPSRRRSYFVRRRFQLRFIGLLVLQMSVVLAAISLLILSHVRTTAAIATTAVGAANRLQLHQDLTANVHSFYIHSLVLLGVTTVLLVTFGLFASHRLAGPVVKLQGFLTSVAEGDYSQRIAFRRYDHLDDFADRVNAAVDAVEKRRLRAKEIAILLARRSQRLEDLDRRPAVLDEMRNLVSEWREAA